MAGVASVRMTPAAGLQRQAELAAETFPVTLHRQP